MGPHPPIPTKDTLMHTHHEGTLHNITQAHKKQMCMWNNVKRRQKITLCLSVAINRLRENKE